jgi:cell division protein FtsZ
MSINLKPAELTELRPRITVIGVGGAGGNAVNNMIQAGLEGVEFVAANTDAQALSMSSAGTRIQMGTNLTEGLGAGSKPEIGAAAAQEAIEDIRQYLDGVHMLFITAGMGGGTGTGAAPIIAQAAKDMGILTVAVVTKPFEFEGQRRMRFAERGIAELGQHVDTILVIPNQNLFRIANEKTTFADAFQRADDVLRSGVSCITDLMLKEGLINLDFADVRVVMRDMGTAMMGTGEASGEKRALEAAELAISNPLLDNGSMRGAKGLLISITGGDDLTLYEVEEASNRIRREVDSDGDNDVNIIVGATFDQSISGRIRVSVVATGIDQGAGPPSPAGKRPSRDEAANGTLSDRLRAAHSPGDGPPARDTQQAAGDAPQVRAWQGPGSVTIEQRTKPRPPLGDQRGAMSDRPPSAPVFEPLPPMAPRRRPRRPLTDEDFPELADRAEPMPPEPARRGGLFGWMVGRSRESLRDEELQHRDVRDRDDSRDSKDTREEPKHGPAPQRAEDFEADDADEALNSGRAHKPRITRPGGNGATKSEEPFDIPDFFKRSAN